MYFAENCKNGAPLLLARRNGGGEIYSDGNWQHLTTLTLTDFFWFILSIVKTGIICLKGPVKSFFNGKNRRVGGPKF